MSRALHVALFVADRTTASGRLRALQYLPLLQRDGMRVTVCATRPSTYLPRPGRLRSGSAAHRGYLAVGLFLVVVQRVWQILTIVPRVDVVLMQKRLLFGSRSSGAERLLLRLARRHGVRVVLDVDDAIHLGTSSGERTGLHQTVMTIASRADLVLAGSPALVRDFAAHAPAVDLVPTCVPPLPSRTPALRRASDVLRLVWTGSPANAVHLVLAREALSTLAHASAVRLEIVTRLEDLPDVELPQMETVLTTYSPEAEAAALFRADIGLAPLTSTPWTRAKCGGRVLAYFRAALPVVASPVGVQADLVHDGVTGLHATTPAEWSERLRTLGTDPSMRQQLGNAGLQLLIDCRDPARSYPRWRELVTGL